MNWPVGEYAVSREREPQNREVRHGMVIGALALEKRRKWEAGDWQEKTAWIITHVPTGMGIPFMFPTKVSAIKVAVKLRASIYETGHFEFGKLPREVELMRAAFRKALEAIGQ